MTVIKRLILIIFISLVGVITYAQEGDGQICVRSFEDRNGNGTFDANEPLITQGVSANLMNALSVTIDSKLLSDSPTVAQGIICFQQLVTGDYMVVVTSADYSAMTPTTFNASVVAGSIPVRFDFGGQSISTDVSTNINSAELSQSEQDQLLQGVLFGVIGALVIMGVMTIVGMMIYFGVFRRRMKQAMMMAPGTGTFRPVTGPMPAMQTDTGSYPPVTPDNNPLINRDPNEGSPPLFDEDTDQMGAV